MRLLKFEEELIRTDDVNGHLLAKTGQSSHHSDYSARVILF